MNTDDDLNQIERLFRLRESGALTHEEFEAEKSRILNPKRFDPQIVTKQDAGQNSVGEATARYGDNPSNYNRSVFVVVALVLALGLVLAMWHSGSRAGGDEPSSTSSSDVPSISSKKDDPPRNDASIHSQLVSEAPHVGMTLLLDTPTHEHRDFGGWKYTGGQLCENGDNHCAINFFEREHQILLVQSKISKDTLNNELQKNLVQSTLQFDKFRPHEIEPGICNIRGKAAVIAMVNQNSAIIRGVVLLNNLLADISVKFNGWTEGSEGMPADGMCDRSQGQD